MLRSRPIVFLLAAAILVGGYLYWRNLPANKFPRIVNALLDDASFSVSASKLAKGSQALTIADYFTDPFILDTDVPQVGGEHTRAEFRSKFAAATSFGGSASFSASDMEVTYFSNTTAEVEAEVTYKAGGQSGVVDATFYFQKHDGDWLIQQVTASVRP